MAHPGAPRGWAREGRLHGDPRRWRPEGGSSAGAVPRELDLCGRELGPVEPGCRADGAHPGRRGSAGERGPAGANPAGRLRPAFARPDPTGFASSDGGAGRDAGGKYPGTARGAHASVAGCIGAAASHGGRCSSADPAPVPLATVPLAVGPVLPTATPDAAGGMAAPAPGGAAGSALGFAAPAVNAGGNLSAELEALRNIMDELKIDKKGEKKRHRRKSSRDRKDGSRHKRKKRSASPAKKKKKDTKSSSSSSSSSSGGSSDSEDSGDKHLPWVPGKKRRISKNMVLDANTMRFKRRSDLLNFHYRHPGGLAALFLWQVKQRLGGDPPKDSDSLKQVDAAGWANVHGNLKEIRDQKEVSFMCRLLLELGHNRLPVAADLAAMRIREILLAKRDGSNWEKASILSLSPTTHGGHTPIPDGAFVA